jgi:hypothetical protein
MTPLVLLYLVLVPLPLLSTEGTGETPSEKGMEHEGASRLHKRCDFYCGELVPVFFVL